MEAFASMRNDRALALLPLNILRLTRAQFPRHRKVARLK
jgi:hypothetical protein